jgi:CubicO group peptidase (beta-lactamase class C family)
VKKAFLVCVLALCLLCGCSFIGTTGFDNEPASALPLVTSSQDFSGAQQTISPPETSATHVVMPFPGASFSAPSAEASPPPEMPSAPAVSTSAAPSESPSPSPDLPEQLDRIFADNTEFRGSVLIEKDGRVLLAKGYGMADAEECVKITVDTKFLIGSVTKQFTVMAVMQLYEEGLLDIHATLADYIPDFSRGGDITLVHLLTQTSGITDYMNDKPALIHQLPYGDISEENLIGLVKTMPLKFEPGSKYSYSNTNFLLLGYIVEKAGGFSYGEYLAMNILEPLGMKNTGVFDPSAPPENMAVGYTRYDKPVCFRTDNGEMDPDTANAAAGSFGAGCLYSTVGDLELWDRALLTETLLPKTYMEMIFEPAVSVSGAEVPCSYGFGWVIENDPDIGLVCRHTGALSGFRAYNGFFTDKGATVIMLCNIMQFNGRDALIPAVKQVLKAA